MKKQTLYKFGVSTFEDAEIILQHARQDSVLDHEVSLTNQNVSLIDK